MGEGDGDGEALGALGCFFSKALGALECFFAKDRSIASSQKCNLISKLSGFI